MYPVFLSLDAYALISGYFIDLFNGTGFGF